MKRNTEVASGELGVEIEGASAVDPTTNERRTPFCCRRGVVPHIGATPRRSPLCPRSQVVVVMRLQGLDALARSRTRGTARVCPEIGEPRSMSTSLRACTPHRNCLPFRIFRVRRYAWPSPPHIVTIGSYVAPTEPTLVWMLLEHLGLRRVSKWNSPGRSLRLRRDH